MKLGAWSKGLAVATAGTLTLAACSAQTDVIENTSITVAWNQPLYSFNENTSSGNALSNAVILYMTQQGFNYYDGDQNLVDNTAFGTMELISEDPMTVKYTLAEGVTWSDGVAVDATDLLLHWAGLSAYLNEVDSVALDEETGAVTPQTDTVFFDSAVAGTAISKTEVPVINEDGSFELTYTEPSIDWKLNMADAGLPAHVIGKRALGIEDPAEAKQAVRDAILNNEHDALVAIANVWNLDFDLVEMPAEEDLELLVGNGAYTVTDFVQDEFITLTAREDFIAGPATKTQTITVRWIPDALASVQALANGEVDVTKPQATTDVIAAAEEIGEGVVIQTGAEAVYEHIDLNFGNGGPFDPSSYDDPETAKLVRQAFITGVNVNEIIERLIQPLQPEAGWVQSQVFLPGAPGYDESVAANGSEAYGQGDAEGALALLEQAGVSTPIDVNVLYASNNTRRTNEFALYQEQLAAAGFNLIDGGNPSWGSLLGTPEYDAWFFGWQSTSTSPLGAESIFRSDGGVNFNSYANDAVDAAYDALTGEFDEAVQRELLAEIDAELWNDAYGITVFQFPGVTVFNADLTGIDPSPLSPTLFWNYWEWEIPADES